MTPTTVTMCCSARGACRACRIPLFSLLGRQKSCAVGGHVTRRQNRRLGLRSLVDQLMSLVLSFEVLGSEAVSGPGDFSRLSWEQAENALAGLSLQKPYVCSRSLEGEAREMTGVSRAFCLSLCATVADWEGLAV